MPRLPITAWLALAIGWVGLPPATAHAQQVARPVLAVGDWCDYEVQGGVNGKERREVIAVQADGGYTLRYSGIGRERIWVYNANDRVVSLNDRPYTRETESPLFPISTASVGQTIAFAFDHSTRQGVTIEHKRMIHSVKPERVTVPAGTFETLRTEFRASYRHSTGYANSLREVIWYALDPKMKFPVKREFQDYGVSNSFTVRSLIGCGTPG